MQLDLLINSQYKMIKLYFNILSIYILEIINFYGSL